jgi:hypothetical protein
MKDKDIISKGPKKHNPTCYQVQRDIVIPAGTILRSYKDHVYEAQVGPCGKFSINAEHDADVTDNFKKVIAP